MKHTQGPWIVEETNQIIWVGTPKNNYTKIDEIVLHINQDENFKEEVKEKNRANAKLIAAAPEMLAILEKFSNCSHAYQYIDANKEAKELLAKLNS